MTHRLLALNLLTCTCLLGALEISRTAESLQVTLSDEVQMTWALSDAWLLGMQQATVSGVPTTSNDSLRFPIFNDEWMPHRAVYPLPQNSRL